MLPNINTDWFHRICNSEFKVAAHLDNALASFEAGRTSQEDEGPWRTAVYEVLVHSFKDIVKFAEKENIDLQTPPSGEEYVRMMYFIATLEAQEEYNDLRSTSYKGEIDDQDKLRLNILKELFENDQAETAN